jgi:hypothetical protein
LRLKLYQSPQTAPETRVPNTTSAFTLAVVFLAFNVFFAAPRASAQQPTPSITSSSVDSNARSVPVFVSDFELSVASTATQPATPNRPAATKPVQAGAATPTQPPPRLPASVRNDADPVSLQARRMIDFFNLTLLQTLQQDHFTAKRSLGAVQNAGVQISGIFAEADPQNRVRRALLGSAAPGSKFLLYVGVFNLSRPRQPLYALAPAQDSDPRYGPVITLNNYIPLTKFEVDKNPTEEDVRKICAEIVANLATLLNANPSAFSN